MSGKGFFKELRRRNVYKVAITYGITAWLLAQIAGLAASSFEAPVWVMKMVFAVLIIGFPIALILAWAYEMSPQGMIRTSSHVTEENPSDTDQMKPSFGHLLVGILLLTVIGLFIYGDYFRLRSHEIPVLEKSIAVLPMINLNSTDENLEYFSDGVTQEIIDELAKIGSFVLTAFTTSIIYKNSGRPHRAIAEELNVNYLISGTSRIFHSGDSVRLSIELIDPYTQKMIWHRIYNEKMNDAPRLQLAIAKKVAENLDIELTDAEEKSLEKINTSNGESFKLFLHAKAEIAKLSKAGFKNSRIYLKKAIELDSTYAQAHTLLAWSYILGNAMWYPGISISTAQTKKLSQPHIDMAMKLDPMSSDIYLVRGNLNLYYNAEIAAAKKDVDYAIEVNSWPKIPTNYCICTVVATYTSIGETKRANELTTIAKEVDPGNVFIHFDQATINVNEGKYKNAQEEMHRAVDLMDIPLFNFFLGWSYFHDGKYEQALTYLEKSISFGEYPMPLGLAYMSNVHYRLGNETESEYYKHQLEERHENLESNLTLMMAMIFGARGERENTLDLLETAYANGDFGVGYFINIDPIFKAYKTDKRFINLRNRMLYQQVEPL